VVQTQGSEDRGVCQERRLNGKWALLNNLGNYVVKGGGNDKNEKFCGLRLSEFGSLQQKTNTKGATAREENVGGNRKKILFPLMVRKHWVMQERKEKHSHSP